MTGLGGEVQLTDRAWVVLVSKSADDALGGTYVSSHGTEAEADAARAAREHGGGPPYYRVEQVSAEKLATFLANPPG
jgi:hypothetical protein